LAEKDWIESGYWRSFSRYWIRLFQGEFDGGRYNADQAARVWGRDAKEEAGVRRWRRSPSATGKVNGVKRREPGFEAERNGGGVGGGIGGERWGSLNIELPQKCTLWKEGFGYANPKNKKLAKRRSLIS